MSPRVSVVIPTHNRLASLQRAVAAVTAQVYRDFEVVVVDDASTDGTQAWLSDRATTVRAVFAERRGGAGAARNRGIAEARGEFVAFLDDDDTWEPSYLERQVRHLDEHADAALSYADHVERDDRGRTRLPDTGPLMAYSSDLVRMLAEGFIHTMSVVACRRSLLAEVGAFDERLGVVQDLEWYARCLAAAHRFVRLPHALVNRAVPGGLVLRHRQWRDEEQRVLGQLIDRGAVSAHDARVIRTYRALYFAHLGFTRCDLVFGAARMGDALRNSPVWFVRIAARRIARRVGRLHRARPRNAPQPVSP